MKSNHDVEWAVWTWEGVFSTRIPSDWRLHQEASLIELRPPSDMGALHISVLRRSLPGSPRPGEASVLVLDFAASQGVRNPELIEKTNGGRIFAEASFLAEDEEGALQWAVYASVWEKQALLCSFCCDPRAQEEMEIALLIFAGIEAEGSNRSPVE